MRRATNTATSAAVLVAGAGLLLSLVLLISSLTLVPGQTAAAALVATVLAGAGATTAMIGIHRRRQALTPAVIPVRTRRSR